MHLSFTPQQLDGFPGNTSGYAAQGPVPADPSSEVVHAKPGIPGPRMAILGLDFWSTDSVRLGSVHVETIGCQRELPRIKIARQ